MKKTYGKGLTLVLFAVICLVWPCSSSNAQAIINNVPHAGTSAAGVTLDLSTNTLFVADANGGLAFTYDLALTNTGSIPNPAGPASTCTGIAWNPVNGLLYWAIFVAPSNQLWTTDTAGGAPAFVGVIANPGLGVVVGMDFDPLGFLYVNDFNAGQYTQHSPTGGWTGFTCANPSGAGAVGAGITFRGASPAGAVFEVSHGTAAQAQPTLITPLEFPACGSSGASTPIGAPGLFVAGIEFAPSGSTGVAVHYVVEIVTNTITELAANVLFQRGDCDASGVVNGLTDALAILNFLFGGGPAPSCLQACDADDMNGVTILDALVLINWAFLGGPPPTAPFGFCGADVTPGGLSPTCVSFPVCP